MIIDTRDGRWPRTPEDLRYHVTWNGERVQRCTFADTEAGVARYLINGPDGRPLVQDGELVERELRGRIEIWDGDILVCGSPAADFSAITRAISGGA